MAWLGVLAFVGYTKPPTLKGHAGVALAIVFGFFVLPIWVLYLYCR